MRILPGPYTFAMPPRAFLERRNSLWRQLRELTPGTSEFEAVLGELQALIGWSRAQVLAGLGWSELELTEDEARTPGK